MDTTEDWIRNMPVYNMTTTYTQNPNEDQINCTTTMEKIEYMSDDDDDDDGNFRDDDMSTSTSSNNKNGGSTKAANGNHPTPLQTNLFQDPFMTSLRRRSSVTTLHHYVHQHNDFSGITKKYSLGNFNPNTKLDDIMGFHSSSSSHVQKHSPTQFERRASITRISMHAPKPDTNPITSSGPSYKIVQTEDDVAPQTSKIVIQMQQKQQQTN